MSWEVAANLAPNLSTGSARLAVPYAFIANPESKIPAGL
jgi:hypothetical protein